MWGYPVLVLGAISAFLEPFHGHLSPNIDNVSEKLTLRYPHEGPWVMMVCLALASGCPPKSISCFEIRASGLEFRVHGLRFEI
jgi:hypothetical protein